MKPKTFKDLFVEQLKDLYSAEKQLTEALPKVVEAAVSPDLKMAIEAHLFETEGQLERVKSILQDMGESGDGNKCEAMKGLIEEGKEMIKTKFENPAIKDAGIIAAAQRIEHYEIAAYGTAREFAKLLGNSRAVQALQQTLNQEIAANNKLNEIATSGLNAQAAGVEMKKRASLAKEDVTERNTHSGQPGQHSGMTHEQSKSHH